MIHGRDPRFGEQRYRPDEGFESHGVIDGSDDITGGFGFQGLVHLEQFLDRGGTLMLLGSSGALATDSGLLRHVSIGGRGGISTPGSAIRTRVTRRDHPITYGYDDIHHVFRTNGPVYTVPEQFEHWIVSHYGNKALPKEEETEEEETQEDETEEESEKPAKPPGEMLITGFLSGQDELENKGVVLDVPRAAGGRVVLYSFNPLHRHLNHGDHNYVYNAILNWNDFPDPQPKHHDGLAKD